MPTPLSTIHAADEFTNPSELSVQPTVYLEDFITRGGGEHLRRLDQSQVFWTGNLPTKIESGSGKVEVVTSTKQINLDTTGPLLIDPDSTLTIKCNGSTKFSVNPAFGTITFYADLISFPAGTGIEVKCDGFIEHSLARFKDNISDISDSKTILSSMRARKYDVSKTPTMGFIVEESPPEVVSTWEDEHGEHRGINLTSVMAILVDRVQALEAEVTQLKGGLK